MPPRFASLPHCLADGRQLFSVCARLAGNDSSDETTAYIPVLIASASCFLLAGAMFFTMQKRCLAEPDTSYLHSGRASPSLCRGWTKPEPLTNVNPVPGLTHGVVQKSEPGQGQMQDYSPQEQQQIMKGQEVIMRAMSGQINWLEASEILRWSSSVRRLTTCRKGNDADSWFDIAGAVDDHITHTPRPTIHI
jgi:hypothetical protein